MNEGMRLVSIATKSRIYKKSRILFYFVFLLGTSLPLFVSLVIFPPLILHGWAIVTIWNGGLAWSLPLPLLVLSGTAPTLIVFMLITAEKCVGKAKQSLSSTAETPCSISYPRYLCSPWTELGGTIVVSLILLEEFSSAATRGLTIVTARLSPTWPAGVCLSLNFLAWWFLAGQFAWCTVFLTGYFLFRVRQMKAQCNMKALDSWIRTDSSGKLKSAAEAMVKLSRLYLIIATLAVVGFWLFRYSRYSVFLLYAVFFPVISYFFAAYSLNRVVRKSKTTLFDEIVKNKLNPFQRASYLHYVSEIDEWPMPVKTLTETLLPLILWLITNFIIPQLTNIVA